MTIRIPAEWEPHACCWMAWAVHDEWRDLTVQVEDELEAIIRTIADFEPVWLLTPPDKVADARARLSGGKVEIIEAPVDDIWMRDIAPLFAIRENEVVAIDLNFNGWGNTRPGPPRNRRRPGDRLASTGAKIFNAAHLQPLHCRGGRTHRRW